MITDWVHGIGTTPRNTDHHILSILWIAPERLNLWPENLVSGQELTVRNKFTKTYTDLEAYFKASRKLVEKATICSELLNKVFTSSADMMMTFDVPLYMSSTTFISWPKECSVSTSSLMICRRLTARVQPCWQTRSHIMTEDSLRRWRTYEVPDLCGLFSRDWLVFTELSGDRFVNLARNVLERRKQPLRLYSNGILCTNFTDRWMNNSSADSYASHIRFPAIA